MSECYIRHCEAKPAEGSLFCEHHRVPESVKAATEAKVGPARWSKKWLAGGFGCHLAVNNSCRKTEGGKGFRSFLVP